MSRRALFSIYICTRGQPCRFSSALLATAIVLSAALANADTYQAWKARVFTEAEQADPAVSSETALSAAGDGIPNLLKYAFGLDPHQDGTLALPVISVLQD